MASDVKATKATQPKAQSEPAPKLDTAAAATAPATDTAAASKTGSGEATGAPSNYSRGEGQKPVTAAYKENWNAIFAKKKPRKKAR